MTENPATWGPAEKVIAQALDDAHRAHQQQIAGLSTPRRVADALRDAGLMLAPHETEATDYRLALAQLQGQVRDMLCEWLEQAATLTAFGSLDDERYAHRIEQMILKAQRELLLK